MKLTPRYTASAHLSAAAGGALTLGALPGAVALQLAPFFKGDPGEPGPQGLKGDKGDPGDLTPDEARSIAADQDAVQVFNYDALVASNLGV